MNDTKTIKNTSSLNFKMNEKKLSVIITARNDDYGGNLINRINTSIKVLDFFVKKYKIPSELIIVDYNPVHNKTHLSKALSVNKDRAFLSVHFLEVPESFHKKCPGNNTTPMLEFLAKNIGIRRAKGTYILSMNPDIILDEKFFIWIAEGKQDDDTYYRVNRNDISTRWFDSKLSVSEILRLAKSSVFMIFLNDKTQYTSWFSWIKRVIVSRNKKSIMMCPLFNKKNDGTNERIIHERAAGDFLIMHRKIWDEVGGYDQEPITGFVDGLILYSLYCLGVKQKILKCPIYHIAHEVGHLNRPRMEMKKYRDVTDKMINDKILYRKKNDDWGAPKEKFKESIFL